MIENHFLIPDALTDVSISSVFFMVKKYCIHKRIAMFDVEMPQEW